MSASDELATRINAANVALESGETAREQANTTLKALAAWSGAITGILGITSVLGLSFDAGSLAEFSRSDQKTVVYFGLAALLLAIAGTAIATVANGVWNKPPDSEALLHNDVTAIESHVRGQIDHKKTALFVSILAVVLAIVAASWALKTAALAEPAPVTEGNRLMAVEEGTAKSTLCGGLEISTDGEILFRAVGANETVPVPDISQATRTGDCDDSSFE